MIYMEALIGKMGNNKETFFFLQSGVCFYNLINLILHWMILSANFKCARHPALNPDSWFFERALSASSQCSPCCRCSPNTGRANQSTQKRAETKCIAFDRFFWPDIGTEAGLIFPGCALDLASWADERWQMMRVAPGGLRTRQAMIC